MIIICSYVTGTSPGATGNGAGVTGTAWGNQRGVVTAAGRGETRTRKGITNPMTKNQMTGCRRPIISYLCNLIHDPIILKIQF